MTTAEKLAKLNEMLEEISFYGRVGSKLAFDQETTCPRMGMEQGSKDLNKISEQIFKIRHSKKFMDLVIDLNSHLDELDPIHKRLIEVLYKQYNDNKNVTNKMNNTANEASSTAYIKWIEAKEKSDYEMFKPYLKKVIDITKKIYLTREEQKETLYDTIIADYEPGWSVKRYDEFFDTLKTSLIPLINKIQKSKKKIRRDFLSFSVPIYKQEEFSKYLLLREGHTFDRLAMLTTEHPFTSKMGADDVRVTTHYYENNFLSNAYSIMHEGGHALFDLNEPKEFVDNYVDGNMTMAMHECMSRLFENMITRSKAFTHLMYPKFKELFSEEFPDVTEEQLYEAANLAEPSLNRCDADELTYSLHIVIRYELEKEFINGKTNVNGLNKKWNKLYKQYLGVKVPNDIEGILQDVHWTGSYGYFPTYALGSAYAAQIYHKMNQEFDVEEAIANDNIIKVVEWLKDHAWNIASLYEPDVWIKKVTGEEFNPKYYIEYLTKKYSELYELD